MKQVVKSAREREVEVARMRDRIGKAGHQAVEVVGDGNCLFRAVAVGFGERESEYKKYRGLAQQGAQQLAQAMGGGQFAISEARSMIQDREWAGESALAAIAHITGRRVRVITGLERMEDRVYGSGEGEVVVGFNGHDHYWGTHGLGSRVRENGMGAPLYRPEVVEMGGGNPNRTRVKGVEIMLNRAKEERDRGRGSSDSVQQAGGRARSGRDEVVVGGGDRMEEMVIGQDEGGGHGGTTGEQHTGDKGIG